MQNNYYWSDEWSEEFYIELAQKGFISTTYDTKDSLLLLPELQFSYAVLEFDDLHISKKVKKLLDASGYVFSINNRLKDVIDGISLQHKDNWLKGKYVDLIKKLHRGSYKNFKLISVEIIKEDKVVAGEIGYIIGRTYTSLSGFSLKQRQYNNYGHLQLVLLAKYLKSNRFDFWNLGHPHMSYKKNLGAKEYSRKEFLKKWQKSSFTNH